MLAIEVKEALSTKVAQLDERMRAILGLINQTQQTLSSDDFDHKLAHDQIVRLQAATANLAQETAALGAFRKQLLSD